MNSIHPSFNSQCKDTNFMWNKHKKEAWNMKCFTFFITSFQRLKRILIMKIKSSGESPYHKRNKKRRQGFPCHLLCGR